MSRESERIVELQRQVKIARECLEKISRNYYRNPMDAAAEALTKIWPLDRKQPLQGLVGHAQKSKPR